MPVMAEAGWGVADGKGEATKANAWPAVEGPPPPMTVSESAAAARADGLGDERQ